MGGEIIGHSGGIRCHREKSSYSCDVRLRHNVGSKIATGLEDNGEAARPGIWWRFAGRRESLEDDWTAVTVGEVSCTAPQVDQVTSAFRARSCSDRSSNDVKVALIDVGKRFKKANLT